MVFSLSQQFLAHVGSILLWVILEWSRVNREYFIIRLDWRLLQHRNSSYLYWSTYLNFLICVITMILWRFNLLYQHLACSVVFVLCHIIQMSLYCFRIPWLEFWLLYRLYPSREYLCNLGLFRLFRNLLVSWSLIWIDCYFSRFRVSSMIFEPPVRWRVSRSEGMLLYSFRASTIVCADWF